PGEERLGAEARDGAADERRSRIARPEDAGPARPEQPLVAARREEVAAELRRRLGFGAEAVHSVDAEQDAVVVVALSVDAAQHLGDLRQWQLEPSPGMDPGQREHTRVRP